MRKTTTVASIALALTAAATARAGDILSIGVGPVVSLGAAATTGLSPQDAINAPNTGLDPVKAGPSFGGVYGGGGLMADLRLVKVLGVEVDLYRTLVGGKATFPGAAIGAPGYTPELSLEQWQWQVAILGKFAMPTPIVAPYIAVGPEFAFPDGQPTPPASSLKITPPIPAVNMFARAGGYTMLTGIAGVEIKIPLPKIDIRIPVGVRLSYNLSSPDSPAVCGALNGMQLAPQLPASGDCRVKFDGTLTPTAVGPLNVTFRTEWKYMVGGFAGIAFYF